MDCNGIGVFDLVGILKGINSDPILKINRKSRRSIVYFFDNPYVTVKNSASLILAFSPENIIIVFYLHYLIALTQSLSRKGRLPLVPRRRIENSLKHFVYIYASAFAFS